MKKNKLIICIVVSVIATIMLIVGPILMQEFNGKIGSSHDNQIVC
jgi:hypothetical protein